MDASKLERQKGRIIVIEEWLKSSGLSGDALKEKMMEYKIALFTGISPSDLEDYYEKFMSAILSENLWVKPPEAVPKAA